MIETLIKTLQERKQEIIKELSGFEKLQLELKSINDLLLLHAGTKYGLEKAIVVKKSGKGAPLTQTDIKNALTSRGGSATVEEMVEYFMMINPTAEKEDIKTRIRKMASRMYVNGDLGAVDLGKNKGNKYNLIVK